MENTEIKEVKTTEEAKATKEVKASKRGQKSDKASKRGQKSDKTSKAKVEKKADSKAQTKSESKETAKPADKPERVTLEKRVANLLKSINTNERIQLETAETAVNGTNSASITQNAIMLTLVSAESNSAKRVIEIWPHSKRVDVCIAKRVYERLASVDTVNGKRLADYARYIDPKAKSSKNVFKLADDGATASFVNLVIASL